MTGTSLRKTIQEKPGGVIIVPKNSIYKTPEFIFRNVDRGINAIWAAHISDDLNVPINAIGTIRFTFYPFPCNIVVPLIESGGSPRRV
jgi:hypothetical protein